MGHFISAALALVFAAGTVAAQSVVTGKVLGADGKPLVLANVFLTEPNDSAVVQSVEASRTGDFRIEVPYNGIWILRFTGVCHHYQNVALYLEKPQDIQITVRLGAYQYVNDFDKVRVVGNFNRWSVLNAVPMKKRGDGTYVAEVKTVANPVEYRLRYARKWAEVEGPQAGSYVYNGKLGYNSVASAKDGIARIVFDPRRLARSGKPAGVTFSGTGRVTVEFARIYDDLEKYKDQFSSAELEYMANRRRSSPKFAYDWSAALKSMQRRIDRQKTGILKEELYLSYNTIGIMSKESDKAFFTAILGGISPGSAVWALNPHSLFQAVNRSTLSASEKEEYVMNVLRRNPNVRVKSAILMDEFMANKLSNQNEKAKKYYDMLQDRYRNTPEAEQIRRVYGNSFQLAVGNPAPAFSVPSSDNMVKLITNGSLRGKYYLICFWAATDPRSTAEIAYLHKAFDRYREKDLNILTISVDTSFADVVKFQKEKRSMPWLNAFVGRSRDTQIVRAFRAYTVPKTYLVDPGGIVRAEGSELIGAQLERTLNRFLGE